jgi:hypothetical protein
MGDNVPVDMQSDTPIPVSRLGKARCQVEFDESMLELLVLLTTRPVQTDTAFS